MKNQQWNNINKKRKLRLRRAHNSLSRAYNCASNVEREVSRQPEQQPRSQSPWGQPQALRGGNGKSCWSQGGPQGKPHKRVRPNSQQVWTAGQPWANTVPIVATGLSPTIQCGPRETQILVSVKDPECRQSKMPVKSRSRCFWDQMSNW